MKRHFTARQQMISKLLQGNPELTDKFDAMHCENLITLFKKLHLLAIKLDILLKNRTNEARGDILRWGMEREKEIYKSFRKREQDYIKKHTEMQNVQQ